MASVKGDFLLEAHSTLQMTLKIASSLLMATCIAQVLNRQLVTAHSAAHPEQESFCFHSKLSLASIAKLKVSSNKIPATWGC